MGIADYENHDALGLAELVRNGDTTPDELLDCAIERLEKLDPTLNAVPIPMIDEARASIQRGLPDGPLRGVPFLLKDLHLYYAGVRTTNGCRMFADHVPDHDSEMVARYKQAGLVIFGKSASPEFGLSTSTESKLFGRTDNPWKLGHTSGGSSGGASSAVAAGILPAANASDGGGSIRIPASCCGLFGLKPSRGRIPFGPDNGEGWNGMSTIHAVTRSVRDSAALLDAVCAPELGAPYAAPPQARPYAEEVGANPGKLRIALQTEAFNGREVHPECVRAVEIAAEQLRSLGHEVRGGACRPRLRPARQRHAHRDRRAPARDARSARRSPRARTRAGRRRDDVVVHDADGREHRRSRVRQERAHHPPVVAHVRALLRGLRRARHADDGAAACEARDAVAQQPGTPGSSSTHSPMPPGFTQVTNASGNPSVSVPLHWSEDGLPIGTQITSRFGDEALLFQLGAQLEEALPWFDRRAPVRLGAV